MAGLAKQSVQEYVNKIDAQYLFGKKIVDDCLKYYKNDMAKLRNPYVEQMLWNNNYGRVRRYVLEKTMVICSEHKEK